MSNPLRVLRFALSIWVAAVTISVASAGEAPAPFDPKPWLEDLEQTRAAISTKYANLEWLVLEREVDLAALFVNTKAQLQTVSSDAEARATFDTLARRFGDGHVRFQWKSREGPTTTAHANCSELGYTDRIRAGLTAGMVPGYTPLVGAPAPEFPAGTLEVMGHRIGVIKIGIFTPDGMPELCAESLSALSLPASATCDEACGERIAAWISDRMTRDLEAQLRAIKTVGADVLIIDVASNGGGTEWAEAAARMVTAVPLKSGRFGVVRGPHWANQFADAARDLRAAAKSASPKDAHLLEKLAQKALSYQQEADIPCDSRPLWEGKRLACTWLVPGFYASGLIDSADPTSLKGKPWAKEIFSPLQFPYQAGIWDGPLIVLVNGGTGSAAEEFAAILQDHHAAVIMGAPTVGAGCGHTNGGTPTTLKNSGGILELPDCARLRADGSNEVMGIQPDVLVGLRATDGPHRQGIRVAEKLPEAVARAIKAH